MSPSSCNKPNPSPILNLPAHIETISLQQCTLPLYTKSCVLLLGNMGNCLKFLAIITGMKSKTYAYNRAGIDF